MMNPVKKITNIHPDTQLVIAFGAMHVAAAAITAAAVVGSVTAVVYGTVKVVEHVTDDEN